MSDKNGDKGTREEKKREWVEKVIKGIEMI